MPAVMTSEAHFLHCYTRLARQAWCDEEFSARLAAESRTTFAAFGLAVPDEIDLEVRLTEGRPDPRTQLLRWREGARLGRVVVDFPRVEGIHLSESDLSTVVGGAEPYAPCACDPCQSGPVTADRGNPGI
jgi:hypothetical protein